MKDLSRAKGSETTYRTQIQQLDRMHQHVPDWLKSAATKSPGSLTPDSPMGRRAAKLLGKISWAGGGLTVYNEVSDAATGEQTWGKAVASTAGQLGGGWIGGVTGAAVCSSLFPPIGPIVCGAAGMGAGSFAGGEVVDAIIPDESDLPEKADRLTPAGRWGTSGQ